MIKVHIFSGNKTEILFPSTDLSNSIGSSLLLSLSLQPMVALRFLSKQLREIS